jgi:hypothetical protein
VAASGARGQEDKGEMEDEQSSRAIKERSGVEGRRNKEVLNHDVIYKHVLVGIF